MEQPSRPSDGDLLAEFLAGKGQTAFTELVNRHGAMVHGVALRVLADHHEAQDVAQAVFLALGRKASALRGAESVGGWLHKVAWRVAMDVQRSRRSRQQREEIAMREQPVAGAPNPDAGLFRAELDAALNQLPERYRQPLVLFHLEGGSLDEVGHMLGLNPNTLRTRLARAREMLRKKLVRRGVTVGTVGALMTLLSAEAGAAVLPATFVSVTVQAASLAAAGQLAAGVGTGVVSAKAAALAKGAVNMLFWSSVKTAAVGVAAAVVVAGSGALVAQEVAQRQAAEQTATEAPVAVPANLATNGVEDIALPDTAEALFRYGQQMEKQGKIAIACRAYKTFLERYPDHSQIQEVGYRLGRCLYLSGDDDKAIKTIEEATRIRNAKFRNRPEALYFLGKLYIIAGDEDKGCKTLETLLGEGAGLYEEAALNMCGYSYARLKKYDEAAAKYSVLERRTNSPHAKDAAYGLAMLRLMAERLDLAKNAIESFVQRYPGDARIAKLFLHLARAYYAKKQYKNAMELCQQILTGFKDAPEAIEAAFLIALIHRDSEQFEQAADCLLRMAHMPQATNNAALAAEAIFESAQILRQQLKQPDKAADNYHEAAIRLREPVTERERAILEQSLFHEAEFRFQQQKWGAAFDLYAQLSKLGGKLNVEERMQYCQSKLNAPEKAVGREAAR